MYKEYIDITNGIFTGLSIAYFITGNTSIFILSLIFILISLLFHLLNNKK